MIEVSFYFLRMLYAKWTPQLGSMLSFCFNFKLIDRARTDILGILITYCLEL